VLFRSENSIYGDGLCSGNCSVLLGEDGNMMCENRGGAADFKVGVENRIFFVPPLFQMWGYKQANISRGLLNILKFAAWRLVAFINIGRPRSMVL